MILCDTNILIEFYKGNSEIIDELQKTGFVNLAVSVVTIGELFYGARDKQELGRIQKQIFVLSPT
jgi:tRNA(fMet)-specific endonuclease VapC